RVFRGMLGETPLEMHRRLRLERAASQLLESEAAVTRIAFDAGYETHEAFTRAFHRAYGVSPTSLRQRALDAHRDRTRPPPTELPAPSGAHYRGVPQKMLPVHFIERGDTMNVVIEEIPSLRVAAVHHVGPYQQIAHAFERLDAIARRTPGFL